jgi:hypothetical protein
MERQGSRLAAAEARTVAVDQTCAIQQPQERLASCDSVARMSHSHTASRAMHWIASIYVIAWLVIAIIAVLGLICWGIYAVCRSLDASWACLIAMIAFSLWASNKVADHGMAWEHGEESQSDEQRGAP